MKQRKYFAANHCKAALEVCGSGFGSNSRISGVAENLGFTQAPFGHGMPWVQLSERIGIGHLVTLLNETHH